MYHYESPWIHQNPELGSLASTKKGLADAAVAALSADRRLVWGHCRVYDYGLQL